jgi:adenosylhomocysteine nucleosidase
VIALLGALREELSNVVKDMAVTRHTSHSGWRMFEGIYSDKKIVLVQTGMGSHAEQATQYLLEHFQITALVSFGFGGALTANLAIGDLILCQNFYQSDHLDHQYSLASDPELLKTAVRVMHDKPVGWFVGDGLTVSKLVCYPGERAMWNKIYNAKVVDMESFWIAEIAAQGKVPFLGVRAISDRYNERLPPFDTFLDTEGKWLKYKTLRHFLSNPGDLKAIPLLYVHSKKARRRLTKFIRAFVNEIP